MEVRLDEKVFNADDVRKLGIEVGDFIAFDPRVELTNGFVRSRHLDDKAGVACIFGAVKAMQKAGLKPRQTTTLLITNYEEVGHGAACGFPQDLAELVCVDMAAIGDGQNSDEFHSTLCLKRKDNVDVSASLATIVVERIFDGVVMLFFVFVALPFAPLPSWLRQVVVLSSLLFFGLLLVFFALAASPRRAQVAYTWAVQRLVPAAWQGWVMGALERFMAGLCCLRSGRDLAMIFVTSVAIWLTETVKYWFVMHGFGFSVPFFVLMLMAAVVNLATTIPSAPGYVGTFDKPGIAILAGFGVAEALAAGYTLVLHAALWLPITLLGVYYMWRESVSWRDFGRAAEARRQEAESAPADLQ